MWAALVAVYVATAFFLVGFSALLIGVFQLLVPKRQAQFGKRTAGFPVHTKNSCWLSLVRFVSPRYSTAASASWRVLTQIVLAKSETEGSRIFPCAFAGT